LDEWNEVNSQIFGGGFDDDQSSFKSSAWDGHFARSIDPKNGSADVGFRLAALVPEPGTGLLVFAGLLGLAGWRRKRE
jgi:hypothetical protein